MDYELEIPKDCPVPLGAIGEEKTAGAFVYDYGDQDFLNGIVVIRNAADEYVQTSLDKFRYESADENGNPVRRYTAFPKARYRASTTACLANDYALVFASNQIGIEPRPGDPYGRVTLTYERSDIRAAVKGPIIPTSNEIGTWSANVSGGYTPYTYRWYRDGAYVGSGSSYSTSAGTRDFVLRMEVTDATMSMKAAVFPVDVDGVLASMNGPHAVYLSQGGGTWNLSGQGGTLPYTFNWYVDGDWTGSGSSWSGYPGEWDHALRVDMRDAVGATHSASMNVQGIGNDSCTPEPPAITC